MGEKKFKQERISDDEGGALSEENVSLAEPMFVTGLIEADMDGGSIKKERIPDDQKASYSVEVDLGEKIEEEKISDEGGGEDSKWTAIKVEYPLDNHESNTDHLAIDRKPNVESGSTARRSMSPKVKLFEVNMDEESSKGEINTDDQKGHFRIGIGMEIKSSKEERVSDDEDGAVNEKEVFLSGPIKIEYPLVRREDKSTSGFGSLVAKTELEVADREPMQQKMEVGDASETQPTDDGSTSSSSRLEQSFVPEHSNQERESEAMDKQDQSYQLRCSSSNEVSEILRSGRQVFGVQLTDSWECAEPKSPKELGKAASKSNLRDESQQTFSRNVDLREFHTGKKPFRCGDCHRRYANSSTLKAHQRTHTGEKLFQCDDCQKQFSQNIRLKVHQRTHTGEKPFQCDECGKQFSQSSSLIIHRRIHRGEKPFQCGDCDRSFADSGGLKVHQRTHTGDNPFQCDECHKQFSQNIHLKLHQRTHTGEKPFQCGDCHRRFAYSNGLKVHQRTHTGEKPFQCDDCHQSFMDNSSLKRHERTHTGDKPFQCGDCDRGFRSSSNLKKHQSTHVGDKHFECGKCQERFSKSTHLKAHQRVHARENPISVTSARNISCER